MASRWTHKRVSRREPQRMSKALDRWGEREPHVLAEGPEITVNAASARRTRRSFVVGAAAAAAGYGLWRWINNSPPVGHLQAVLRRSLLANAALDRGIFDERGLAPEYPLSRAVELRLNGVVGLEQELAMESYRLQVAGVANAKASPRYVPDVTAWDFRYVGEIESNAQSDDVKSAPGNGPVTKSGKSPKQPSAAGAPSAQQSRGQGSASGASPQTRNASQPGSPKIPAALPNGAPGTASASIAERFERMAQQITHKRYQGDAEAGASYSSLDIGTPGLLLSMADLGQLPKVELITEFKCVEGWSQIVQWSGYRLRDFIDAYPPERVNGREPRYVYMETPDGNYYGGYNLLAARHPQSLLVTEMSGQPLSQHHGAPLRLYMPIKYGYKNLKRIGLIAYTDTKPDDFWTKLGYDWYAGL